MSMDLQVWSAQPFKFPEQLPKADSWKRWEDSWQYDGANWLINVSIEEDEPDDSVTGKLPTAKHMAFVSLEPIAANAEGYAFLEEVTRGLCRQTGGVWVEPSGEVYFHDEGKC